MQTYLTVAIGGVLGCWLRLAMGTWIPNWLGRDFPYATLIINVLGSFLMGFLYVSTVERFVVSPHIRVGILTGFLGGFTTFSAFSMEMLLLIQNGEPAKGALYGIISLLLGLAAAFAGAFLARAM